MGSQAVCDQQHIFLIWWRNRTKQSNISRNGIYAFGLIRAYSGTYGSQWDSTNSFTPDLTFIPSPPPRFTNKKNNIALWGFSSVTNSCFWDRMASVSRRSDYVSEIKIHWFGNVLNLPNRRCLVFWLSLLTASLTHHTLRKLLT